MNIANILDEQARTRPDATAIIERGRSISFRELNEATARCATLLTRSGIQKSSVVLMLHPISIDLYVFLIALLRLGAIAMVVDPSAGRKHLEDCCRMLPPQAFFGSTAANLLALTSRSLRQIPLKFSSSWMPGAQNIQRAHELSTMDEIAEVDDDSAALVTFTSGSTGRPKAAQRGHRFLIAQNRVLQTTLGLSPESVDLPTLPIFVLSNLAAGTTSVLPDADLRRPGSIDANRLARQIREHSIESTAGSPALFARLVEHGGPFPSLRRVFAGGAPVFPKLMRACANVFPNSEITAVYGSTEAEPMAELRWSEVSADDLRSMSDGGGLLAGKVVPAVQLRIIRDQWGKPLGRLCHHAFEEIHTRQGEPGEIVVTGDHVLKGYLHGEGDEETKFNVDESRWHRTGDLGYFDVKGRLWLLGRCAAKIEDSKGTLYPFAVESAAQELEGIRRAAVIGENGRRVLVVEGEAGARVSQAELKEKLSWAQLDSILALKCIPVDRRHNAKIDYPALRDLLKNHQSRL
jgi:olefin beta-lactone synthetase